MMSVPPLLGSDSGFTLKTITPVQTPLSQGCACWQSYGKHPGARQGPDA